MKRLLAAAMAALALFAARADDKPPANSGSSGSASQADSAKSGDHYHFNSKTCGYVLRSGNGAAAPAAAPAVSAAVSAAAGHAAAVADQICAPPDVNVYVTSADSSSSSLVVQVQDLPDQCFDSSTPKGWWRRSWSWLPWEDNSPWSYNRVPCGDIPDTDHMVRPLSTYTLSQDEVAHAQAQRYGFAAGALAIPFKLILHGSTVSPGGSLGPYVGYKFEQSGSAGVSAVISGGVSAGQSTTTNSNGTSTAASARAAAAATSSPSTSSSTSTQLNLYAATGVVAQILGVQMAVLAGQDLGAKSSTTHRWWISFGVGATFTK